MQTIIEIMKLVIVAIRVLIVTSLINNFIVIIATIVIIAITTMLIINATIAIIAITTIIATIVISGQPRPT